MTNSVKFTEQQLNLKLVKEVEKYPCLYNSTLLEYGLKDITEKAWGKIGEKVNLTGNECKERWKNIRTVFGRSLKPVQIGLRPKSKKPYYLADAMQFTLPFIKFLQSNTINIPGLPTIKQEQLDESEENVLNTNNYEVSVTISSPRSTSLPSTSPRPSSLSSSPPSSPQPLPSTQPMTSKDSCHLQTTRKRSQEDEKKCFDEDPVTKRSKAEEHNDQKEANKMFLLSLLPDMNEMSLSQIRKFKKKVIDTINDIFENMADSLAPKTF